MSEGSAASGVGANGAAGRGLEGQDPGHGAVGAPAGERTTSQALRALTVVSAAVPGAVARRAGLSHNELAVLELLAEGPHGPSELARSLEVTTAAASGIVDRLVARGHAERSPHPQDRRRTVVAVSASGRETLVAELMPMFEALRQLEEELSVDEREVVRGYLERATEAMRRAL